MLALGNAMNEGAKEVNETPQPGSGATIGLPLASLWKKWSERRQLKVKDNREAEDHKAKVEAQKSSEQRQLEFERYKALLDFWKFVLGSVVAAIAIAAIPPLFQYGTAYLEQVKGETHLRNEVVREYVLNALDKNIENRIRLAHYFARVADSPFREGWVQYYTNLITQRDDLQKKVLELEKKKAEMLRGGAIDRSEVDQIDIQLVWLRDQQLGLKGSEPPSIPIPIILPAPQTPALP